MTVAHPLCDKAHCTETSFLVFKMQTYSFSRIGNVKAMGLAEERGITEELMNSLILNMHLADKKTHTRYGIGTIRELRCQYE